MISLTLGRVVSNLSTILSFNGRESTHTLMSSGSPTSFPDFLAANIGVFHSQPCGAGPTQLFAFQWLTLSSTPGFIASGTGYCLTHIGVASSVLICNSEL